MKEIERSFLIDEFPDHLKLLYSGKLFIVYTNTDPEEKVFMDCKVSDTLSIEYIKCSKSGDSMIREKVKNNITEYEFFDYIHRFKGIIYKEYKVYDFEGGELWCMDVDSSFMYCEVEFDSEEDAISFIPLEFMKEEKTNDESFRMKNYWSRKYLHL